MGRLDKKVAFITGAGSGIARAAAYLFAREGAKVVIAEIKSELGTATALAVRDAGGDALFVETDVTKEDSVQQAITATMTRYDGLHVLYNCAGGSIPQDGPVTTVSMDVWQHTISLDLLGTFLCCRYGIPEMIQSGGGAIVNMASVVALEGSFPFHVYTAAKGGVMSFTKALAGEYSKHNIRANVICPGMILTDRVKQRFGERAAASTNPQMEAMRARFKEHPFSVGPPEDIAQIALFLAADESRMITGAVIPADGGLSAY